MNKARTIFERLQRRYVVEFDAAGAIGRRYRRMDEVRALAVCRPPELHVDLNA